MEEFSIFCSKHKVREEVPSSKFQKIFFRIKLGLSE